MRLRRGLPAGMPGYDLRSNDARRDAVQATRPLSFRALQAAWRPFHRAANGQGQEAISSQRKTGDKGQTPREDQES